MSRAPDTRRQRNLRRVFFALVATFSAFSSVLAHPSEPAGATAGEESAFVSALNQVRADNGLPAFLVNVELSNLSRDHAQVMADADEIFHANPISAGFGGEWAKLGENVGVGADVAVLVDAFVASPGHFANIIDPSFTEVGVGVVWKDTAMYTAHRFLQPPVAAPVTTTVPAPAPTTTTTTVAAEAAPPITPSTPTSPPTTTTTTILPPLAPPAISAARVMVLFDMLDEVGT